MCFLWTKTNALIYFGCFGHFRLIPLSGRCVVPTTMRCPRMFVLKAKLNSVKGAHSHTQTPTFSWNFSALVPAPPAEYESGEWIMNGRSFFVDLSHPPPPWLTWPGPALSFCSPVPKRAERGRIYWKWSASLARAACNRPGRRHDIESLKIREARTNTLRSWEERIDASRLSSIAVPITFRVHVCVSVCGTRTQKHTFIISAIVILSLMWPCVSDDEQGHYYPGKSE